MTSIDIMRAMIWAGFFLCAALFRAQYLLWQAQRTAKLRQPQGARRSAL